MKIPRVPTLLAVALTSAVAQVSSPRVSLSQDAEPTKERRVFSEREQAYRANNLGVALLEQYKPRAAAVEAFRRSLQIAPDLELARINLAIALFNVPDPEQAQIEARKAAEMAPEAPQAHYMLGLIARGNNQIEAARAAFDRCWRSTRTT